ncbi:hypothetical protein AA313_de0203327 [Arthrobotrys entomopaga]|nr:hypothetical protein AA313_de0203327 [Arthrobotrys entomopaga]
MLSLPVSPVPPPPMSRRVPLSNIQNHSQPHINLNTAIPAKRPAKPTRDALGPPPSKKAHLDDAFTAVDQKENRLVTPSKLRLVPKTPSRNDNTAQPRRDVAAAAPPSRIARAKAPVASRRNDKLDTRAKERRPGQQPSQKAPSLRERQMQQAAVAENNEAIRQWQRHYFRVFPTLTFYMDDSVPDDKKAGLRLRLADLNSTVLDKWSAKEVTHVLTTRDDVPPEFPKELANATINPKLLGIGAKADSRDSSLPKLNVYDNHKDVLVLARLNNKKIWSVEKVDRMINTLHEKIEDEIPSPEKRLPSKLKRFDTAIPPILKYTAEDYKRDEAILEKLLREDKHHGTQSSTKEMYTFKGPYLMVGDASGRYKPFIIREYQNAKVPEDGDWPQFRSNREGRCPFVLDPDTKRAYMREEAEKEAEAKAKLKEKEKEKEREAARLRTKTSMEPPPRNQSLKAKTSSFKEELAKPAVDRKPLSCIENKVDRDLATAAAATAIKKTEGRLDKLREIQRARQNHLVVTGYEPVASGLQATGPTSAVFSQAISSNTAVVGPKAGTSRDVQRLGRRVFEKTTVGIRQTNTAASLNVPTEEEVIVEEKAERKSLKRNRSQITKKEVKKQPQAGYCENCRDKYDDFEEHIGSKRHLRFASNNDNFIELDALLASLKRPRKQLSPFHDYDY